MNNIIRRRTMSGYKRCAFTGYRPAKMPFGFDESDARCVEFKARLRDTIEALIGEGYAHFISGGALGMDMFAAEAVLELQEKYPWIILEMVSPFDAQADRWNDEYRMRHDRLFAAADIMTATNDDGVVRGRAYEHPNGRLHLHTCHKILYRRQALHRHLHAGKHFRHHQIPRR